MVTNRKLAIKYYILRYLCELFGADWRNLETFRWFDIFDKI
jgi:hypothetical protein